MGNPMKGWDLDRWKAFMAQNPGGGPQQGRIGQGPPQFPEPQPQGMMTREQVMEQSMAGRRPR